MLGSMPLLHAPLSVRGAQIIDAAGNPVRLAGVSWGGAHQDGLVPAGLDKLHRDEIARRIVGWGFNHVRLTFALGTFVSSDGSLKTGPADVGVPLTWPFGVMLRPDDPAPLKEPDQV